MDDGPGEFPHKRHPNRYSNGRFRRGVSGNPKGRPRKARSTRAIFQEMLTSKVTMKVDGKLRRLSVTEAMAARVKREALAGPLRGLEKGITIAQLYSVADPREPKQQTEPEQEIDLSSLTDEELEWYGRIAAKMAGVPFDSLSDDEAGPPELPN